MSGDTLHTTEAFAFEDEAPLPVVVGVDGSANAESAASWAAAEADRRGATLIVVHAVSLSGAVTAPLEPSDLATHRRAEERALLDRTVGALRERFPSVLIQAEVSGHSPEHILNEHSRAASLIVTGTRGHGGFTGMLVGSVSRKLAAHAACPLIVVHPTQPEDGTDDIVLGIGRKPSPAAVRYAFEAARRQHAELTVVRAWWPRAVYYGMAGPGSMYVGELDTARADAQDGAEAAVAEARSEFRDVKLHIRVAEGNAVPVLLDAARTARLLVVGAHRHRGPLSIGAGYVVEGVIAHSQTPVAVVPIS